jgi:MFS family permease
MRRLSQSVVNGIYLVLVATLIALVVGVAIGRLGPNVVAAISVAISIVLALLAAVRREVDRPQASEAAQDLAHTLGSQVKEYLNRVELPSRGLDRDRRMGIRWRLSADPSARTELAAALPRRGPRILTELIKLIGRQADEGCLPRLVITGEMGAGKTAACYLLMEELAGRHSIVPVLFNLATWDPGISLRAWMAGELPESLPGLSGNSYSKDVTSILASRYVLPFLDGLDEMGEPAAALKRIETELAGTPFVLTCRTADFRQANAEYVLQRSVVIELQPLAPREVAGILADTGPGGAGSPQAALAGNLTSDPSGPVAAALNTPFMVSLARDTRATLADLLPAAGAPDPVDTIRRSLLGRFADKAFAHADGGRDEQARRYLLFLARHADEAGRIAWWRLHQPVPRPVFFVAAVGIAGTVCSGLAAIFFTLFARPLLGFLIGLTLGILGALVVEFVPQDDPRRARPRLRSVRAPAPNEMARVVGFGVTGGAALATMAFFLYTPVGYAVIGGVLSGLTFAVARYVSQPNDPLKVVTPLSMLRADRMVVLIAWLTGAIAGALTGFYFGIAFRAGHRPGYDTLTILRQPTLVLGLLGAAAGCALTSAGLGLMATGSSSWGRFAWTRLWLAASRTLPLRLMHFLQDACNRGVLRQVNGYYEFRHRTLQRYLAEPSPDASAGPAASA